MDWYEVLAIVLGVILSVWVGFRFSIEKTLKAAKELKDVIDVAIAAYADKQFSAEELKEIEKQFKEFIDSIKPKALLKKRNV